MRKALMVLATLIVMCAPLSRDDPRLELGSGKSFKYGSEAIIPHKFSEISLDDAERSQAASADEMLGLTEAQIILAILGSIGLFVSLYFTSRSLQQTRESLDHARETASRQLRAYLEVRFRDVITTSTGNIRIRYAVINRGQTPARQIVARMWLAGVSDFAWEIPVQLSDKEVRGNSVDIGPGSEATVFQQLSDTDSVKFKANRKRPRHRILVWIHVDYVDAFDEAQWVRFSCFLRGHRSSVEHNNPAFIGGS